MAVYGGGGSRRVNRHVILGIICLLAGQTQQHVVRDGQHGFGQPQPGNFRDSIRGNDDSNEWSEIFADEYRQMIQQQEENDDDDDDNDEVFSGKLAVVDEWPIEDPKTGQVAGLAVDNIGNLHVFHRANRKWKADSFYANNTFAQRAEGPIKLPTVFTLNASNGVVVDRWGENFFYMPHGLHIDPAGNLWMTDVAMHQVFKFERGKHEPSMTLGKAFEPGTTNNDTERFCKPTDVAVTSTGDFYVSDGYCLSRVLKFDKSGKLMGTFGVDDAQIPHSLALAEDLDLICAADRENMRVLCYNAGLRDASRLGVAEREYTDEVLGRVFALRYSQSDGVLYGVTGPTGILTPQGFTIDLRDDDHYKTDIIAYWSPDDKGFDEPHALAISRNGESVYVGETNPENVWKFEKEEH